MVPVREDRVRGGRARLGYSSRGRRVPSYATARGLCACPNREQNGRTNRRAVSSMDSVGKRNHVLIGGPHLPTKGKRNFVQHDDSTMNIVVVIIIIFYVTGYTDTFCNAVDCRLELALEVQRRTRARSECLPGAQKL